MIEQLPRQIHQDSDSFVKRDVGSVFEYLIDDEEGNGGRHDVDDKRPHTGGKERLLEQPHNPIQLFLIALLEQYLVHIDNNLQLVGQQIVLLELDQLAELREDLLDVAGDDEVAVDLVAEAEQEVDDVDQLVGVRHGLEVGVDGDHGLSHLLLEEAGGDLFGDEAGELPHRVV